MANQKPTTNYYDNEGSKIYFYKGEQRIFFKSMDRYPYEEIEQAVDKLNKASGLVPPVDEDYVLESEDEEE